MKQANRQEGTWYTNNIIFCKYFRPLFFSQRNPIEKHLSVMRLEKFAFRSAKKWPFVCPTLPSSGFFQRHPRLRLHHHPQRTYVSERIEFSTLLLCQRSHRLQQTATKSFPINACQWNHQPVQNEQRKWNRSFVGFKQRTCSHFTWHSHCRYSAKCVYRSMRCLRRRCEWCGGGGKRALENVMELRFLPFGVMNVMKSIPRSPSTPRHNSPRTHPTSFTQPSKWLISIRPAPTNGHKIKTNKSSAVFVTQWSFSNK